MVPKERSYPNEFTGERCFMWTKKFYVDKQENRQTDKQRNRETGQETICLCFYRQILDSSKPKEFTDDNFKFHENGRKLSKLVENTEGKRVIACNEQFLHFPQWFSKDFFGRHVKTRACLGKASAIMRKVRYLHQPHLVL